MPVTSSHPSPRVAKADEDIRERLNRQHEFVVKTMNSSLFHPEIAAQLSAPRLIVDIACGTGIWLTEVAALFPDCMCVGIDISNEQFPRQPDLDQRFGPGRVKFLTEDIASVHGPPKEFLDRCDVVAVRLVTIGLNGNAWYQAVQNLTGMLKPGGWLQWIESDPLEDVSLHLNGHCPGSCRLNQAYREQLALYDTSGSTQLPTLMSQAGLIHVTSDRYSNSATDEALVHKNVLEGMRGVVVTRLVSRNDNDWDTVKWAEAYEQALAEAENGSCLVDVSFCCYIGKRDS